MTSITRHFPWFIKDLGVAIVGEKCYVSLVENLDVHDVECLKYSLSKGLGVGIVIGGSIMKLPQLLLIVNAKSARGLSFAAYVLETLSYAITLAYSYRNEYPFSTYGENFFLTIQNIIITLLILHYPTARLTRPPSSSTPKLALASAVMAASGFALYIMPSPTLAMLQAATLPLSLFSKMPQIQQNHRARSTGQLSAFAVISQIVGCLARLFTTSTEVGDPLVSAGFALALLLNIVLGIQLWAYWGKDGRESPIPVSTPDLYAYEEKEKASSTAWQDNGRVEVVVPPASPATPTGSRQAQPGRRWARKVD